MIQNCTPRLKSLAWLALLGAAAIQSLQTRTGYSLNNSIILIGMPGSGKSTLGVQLAKLTARDFVDTDVLIQLQQGITLQEIIEQSDYLNLRRIEELVMLGLSLSNHVIATGGSAVYSQQGMHALAKLGRIVFLDVALDELKQRIQDYATRGIAGRKDQTFDELYQERRALYLEYADTIIDCNGKSQNEILETLRAN